MSSMFVIDASSVPGAKLLSGCIKMANLLEAQLISSQT